MPEITKYHKLSDTTIEPRIVVSLTTTPNALKYMRMTISSLLDQIVTPHAIFLGLGGFFFGFFFFFAVSLCVSVLVFSNTKKQNSNVTI